MDTLENPKSQTLNPESQTLNPNRRACLREGGGTCVEEAHVHQGAVDGSDAGHHFLDGRHIPHWEGQVEFEPNFKELDGECTTGSNKKIKILLSGRQASTCLPNGTRRVSLCLVSSTCASQGTR